MDFKENISSLISCRNKEINEKWRNYYSVQSLAGVEPTFKKPGSRDKSPNNSHDLTSHNKKNQDAYVVIKNFLGLTDHWFFGVFDGHGSEGHKVSHFIKRQLPQSIINNIMLQNQNADTDQQNDSEDKLRNTEAASLVDKTVTASQMIEVMNKSIIDINKSLGPEGKHSGSTCCVCTIVGDKLICANTGDSRAILISKKSADESLQHKRNFSLYTNKSSSALKGNMKKIKIEDDLLKQWKVTQLSRDHKPDLEDEKHRITSTGVGSVLRFESNSGKQTGLYRVFDNHGSSGGLAMSRSIGDHSLTKAGVIPDPEFIEHQITDNDKMLIIASDGVWEFLTNEDVLQLIHKTSKSAEYDLFDAHNAVSVKSKQSNADHEDPHSYSDKVCENITKISKYYWTEYEKNVRDDITIIVILLNSFE